MMKETMSKNELDNWMFMLLQGAAVVYTLSTRNTLTRSDISGT